MVYPLNPTHGQVWQEDGQEPHRWDGTIWRPELNQLPQVPELLVIGASLTRLTNRYEDNDFLAVGNTNSLVEGLKARGCPHIIFEAEGGRSMKTGLDVINTFTSVPEDVMLCELSANLCEPDTPANEQASFEASTNSALTALRAKGALRIYFVKVYVQYEPMRTHLAAKEAFLDQLADQNSDVIVHDLATWLEANQSIFIDTLHYGRAGTHMYGVALSTIPGTRL